MLRHDVALLGLQLLLLRRLIRLQVPLLVMSLGHLMPRLLMHGRLLSGLL